MKMKSNGTRPAAAILMAILAAVLYGLSSPVSKILLQKIPPTLMAALLYLGAGTGMSAVSAHRSLRGSRPPEMKMTGKDLPFILGMIVLDIAAPIFLMLGLTMASAESTSLLNNFEIVATSLIAVFFFKETFGGRMGIAITLITLSSLILSIEDVGSFRFSPGAALVLLACVSWGLENNCTRMLSLKDPLRVVVLKGFGAGTGSLVIALATGERARDAVYILCALLLGFVAYGLSIYFYIRAQRDLGAARTSAYYAAAPFIGVLVSWAVLREAITPWFLTALAVMLLGTYFAVTETFAHFRRRAQEEVLP